MQISLTLYETSLSPLLDVFQHLGQGHFVLVGAPLGLLPGQVVGPLQDDPHPLMVGPREEDVGQAREGQLGPDSRRGGRVASEEGGERGREVVRVAVVVRRRVWEKSCNNFVEL